MARQAQAVAPAAGRGSRLKRDGIDIVQFTRDGCPPSAGGPTPDWATSNAAILRKIAELKPRTVILYAGWARYENYQQPDV
jgi:SGNH domain (fused to AT3 domains)